MANNGWDGQLQEDRFKVGGCFDTGNGTAPHGEWFDVKQLICPTTVGEQIRNKGWTRLERPVDNDNNDDYKGIDDLPPCKLMPGVPGRGYNTAAQEPPGM